MHALVFRLLLCLPIAASITTSFADEPTAKVRESEQEIFAEPANQKMTIAADSVVKDFSFDFTHWAPNSLHWEVPSTFVINSDGGWTAFATRLANNRRTGGSLDTGENYSFGLSLQFYDGMLVNGNCTGAVQVAFDVQLASIGYKSDKNNVTRSGNSADYLAKRLLLNCASASRWMR